MTPGSFRPPGAPPPSLAEVRWLARRVLAGYNTRWVEDLPGPQLLSQTWRAKDPLIREYTLWWTSNPDPAGAFARRTRWLRRLPPGWRAGLLLALRYDGLLYPRDGKILGHVFYQRHADALHVFSTAVSEEVAHSGMSVVMLLDVVALASRLAGISRARVGRGPNRVTRRPLEQLKQHERDLGWRVQVENGWLDFAP